MSDFFLVSIVLIIIFCLFVVLTERKLLAHAQRRFGPSIIGRNGWLQIIVDLIKLANKEFFILPKNSSSLLPFFIVIFFSIQLVFIHNFVFGPNGLVLDNIDGMIFFHIILVILSNIILISIGFLSQSKYSIIGVVRGVVHVVSFDIFITVVYSVIIFSTQSGNFNDFSVIQFNNFFIFMFAPLSISFIIIMLLESKWAPFDHVETEAEVVAGYATESGGIFLLVFYLCEYFHLIISANHFSIFFFGGWSIPIINSLVTIVNYPISDFFYF